MLFNTIWYDGARRSGISKHKPAVDGFLTPTPASQAERGNVPFLQALLLANED
jgi:hypothetical protein